MTKGNWLYCEWCGKERRAEGGRMLPHNAYDNSLGEMFPCDGSGQKGSQYPAFEDQRYHVDTSKLTSGYNSYGWSH